MGHALPRSLPMPLWEVFPGFNSDQDAQKDLNYHYLPDFIGTRPYRAFNRLQHQRHKKYR